MKYFLVSTETENTQLPYITDWFHKINPRDITPERAGNIPEATLLSMESRTETIFPDILSTPGFLVSTMVCDVLKLYDPYFQYRRMLAIDKQARRKKLYFLPILPVCDCLLPESELNQDKSKIIRGVLDLEKTQRRPIVKLGGLTSTHMAFRLDVVESMLRRGAKGIKLTELEIKGGLTPWQSRHMILP